MGITHSDLDSTLSELNVTDRDIAALKQAIAKAVLNVVVNAGTPVVDDYTQS